jgi:hypothetical protein
MHLERTHGLDTLIEHWQDLIERSRSIQRTAAAATAALSKILGRREP